MIVAWRRLSWGAVAATLGMLRVPGATAQSVAPHPEHGMTVQDLLRLEIVDAAKVDPRSSLIAVVVQRSREPGEPTLGEGTYRGNVRGDVTVISASSGEAVMRTHGRSEHSGYWHPVWSPSGGRLAMLKLQGDTLRVCVWERSAGTVSCSASGRSLDYLTQLVIGTTPPGAFGAGSPFLWLSDSILAVALLPRGSVDMPTLRGHRTADSIAAGWSRQRAGVEPSASVLDAPRTADGVDASVDVVLWNVRDTITRAAFRVPMFEQGTRTVVFSPDHERAAVLADRYHPVSNAAIPSGFYNRTSVSLGVADLTRDTSVWWCPPNAYTRFVRWGPAGRRLGVMAKQSDDEDVSHGTRLLVLDLAKNRVGAAPDVHTDSTLRWSADSRTGGAGQQDIIPHPSMSASTGGDKLLASAPNGKFAIVLRLTRMGTGVWQVPASGEAPRLLLALNRHLASVARARRRLITYVARDGTQQHGVVLLPPASQPGRPLPLVVWVYPGTQYTDTLDGHWLRGVADPLLIFLNPNILAGHGYAVLLPSMPLSPIGIAGDPCTRMLDGVDPAIDSVIARGIADPTRLGIIGHSYGGYAVNCIVARSHRFHAAVSVAGVADLTSDVLQFYPPSRYTIWPAVQLPWAETGQGRMGAPPWRDPARYLRNSPISYADSVHAPVLIVAGDNDLMNQAEEWFTALDRAGKRARLVRYWGEGHEILSPANVEHLWREILLWCDSYLGPTRVKNGVGTQSPAP